MTDLVKILILAIVQGAAELLPVSSSAHVTVIARLIHYDILSHVQWTFLLIMLHTGTMFSVLLYFWRRWKLMAPQIPVLLAATAVTGAIGYGIVKIIEKTTGQPIEHFFRNLPIMAASLLTVGILILIAGIKDSRQPARDEKPDMRRGLLIGLVQAICLPFRGFSRSGATISTGMLLGVARIPAEEFSFALAVLLTPAIIAKEGYDVVKENAAKGAGAIALGPLLQPGLIGMVFSFLAGLVALRLLSRLMEKGHWLWFGAYCIVAAAVVLAVNFYLPAPSSM